VSYIVYHHIRLEMKIHYENSKIYCLRNKLNDDIFYVGGTTQTLNKRLYQHKYESRKKRCMDFPVYKYINALPKKIDDVYIEIIQKTPCHSQNKQLKIEGGFIKQYLNEGFPLQNKQIAGRTKKQWKKDTNKIEKGYK